MTSYFCIPVPYDEKDIFFFFFLLVLEGIIGLHRAEVEDIKKRWQEYTELYKKDLHDPDNHDGVITHLDADIWTAKSSGPQEASLQTKLVEVMELQLSYFKS